MAQTINFRLSWRSPDTAEHASTMFQRNSNFVEFLAVGAPVPAADWITTPKTSRTKQNRQGRPALVQAWALGPRSLLAILYDF